ncbi:MAG: TIGR04282 family arsenosugar biosynthesis glycosyltransferase [Terriglobia bacterium]
MVNGTILVFVKAPVAGQVKTRLIPALGAKGALEMFRAMALDTMQVAQQLLFFSVKVAYQAHEAFPDPSWLASEVEWFAQEGEDLGERLIHATRQVFRDSLGPTVIIGTDLPALTPTLLQKAFALLKYNPIVLGPSTDGGYYLIGLTRPIPVLFQGITWSSSKVMEQTQRIILREGLGAATLSLERDIDTPEDLAELRVAAKDFEHFPRTRKFLQTWQIEMH